VVFSDELYDATVAALFRVLGSADSSDTEVLLVAHEPGVHEFALWLLGVSDEIRNATSKKPPTHVPIPTPDVLSKDWQFETGQLAELTFVCPEAPDFNSWGSESCVGFGTARSLHMFSRDDVSAAAERAL